MYLHNSITGVISSSTTNMIILALTMLLCLYREVELMNGTQHPSSVMTKKQTGSILSISLEEN